MTKLFDVNGNLFYAEHPQALKNTFYNQPLKNDPIPTYESSRDKLPKPFWDGHDDAIQCYWRAWELVFENLKKVNPKSGMVSDFIDTAFNGNLFMWDSAFNVMYGKYASRVFQFQNTLDNFYARQHRDGFICRELSEQEPGDRFSRDDPASTGPNILPWAEWEYFCSVNDIDRLERVFDPLCAYYDWLRKNRAWQDGSYWSCGLASGMDNQPRQPEGYDLQVSHGFMSWIDMCAQQYLSADILLRMAGVLGKENEVKWLKDETALLYQTINEKMWSEKDGFYYDKLRDGSLGKTKSVGAYWTLIAGLVPQERLERFTAHLENPKEFCRPHRIPSISSDHPLYHGDGHYFQGGVWPQTNYMVLCGLHKYGYDKLAYDIAKNHLEQVVEVYKKTNTLYENYAPEHTSPGDPAKAGYTGWGALAPIAVMFEYVFGIHPDAQNKKIIWQPRLMQRHGIRNYPLGDATVDLICEERTDTNQKPVIHVESDIPVEVEIIE